MSSAASQWKVHLGAPLRGRRARPLTLSPPPDGSRPRVGELNYHTSSAPRLMTPPPAPYLSSHLLIYVPRRVRSLCYVAPGAPPSRPASFSSPTSLFLR